MGWRRILGLRAFTLIELLIIVAIILLLGLILLPNLARARLRAHRINCTSNLKQIGLSFRVWAVDNNDLFPSQSLTNKAGVLDPHAATNAYVHFQVMSNELSTPRLLACPADFRRTPTTDFARLSDTNISYFVGLDAQNSTPQMFLSGDRNLTNGLALTNHILFLATNLPVGWTRELHSAQGNIGLADGSVQQFTVARLREAVTNAGAGNRLLMP